MRRNKIVDFKGKAEFEVTKFSGSGEEIPTTAVSSLTRWFEFCYKIEDYEDGACDLGRLKVYSEYVVDQVREFNFKILDSAYTFYKIRVGSLWMVWATSPNASSTTANDSVAKAGQEHVLKKGFDIAYTRIWDAARRKIKAIIEGGPTKSSTKSRQSLRVNQKKVAATLSATNTSNSNGVPVVVIGNSKQWTKGENNASMYNMSSIEDSPANPNGTVCVPGSHLLRYNWRVFNHEGDIYLNCILLRRASYCSMQLRLWHLMAKATWLDNNILRSGVNLGSLSISPKRLKSTARAKCIIIHANSVDNSSRVVPTAATTNIGRSVAGNECRRSRSVEGNTEHTKVELLRHRQVLLCPWNALAVLFYYKWHVLNEPPPDFSNSSWIDEPLLRNDVGIDDDYLLDYCSGQYRDFRDAVISGNQKCKYINAQSYKVMEHAIDHFPMLRGTLAATRDVCVSQRMLQNGLYENIMTENAGFAANSASKSYHIARQSLQVPEKLEKSIFPFADYIPPVSEFDSGAIEKERRHRIVGFCNMLKELRTTLLQDVGVLFYTPFYRRMLKRSAVFSSPIFHTTEFTNAVENNARSVWTTEYLPLIEDTPKDMRLGQVEPAPLEVPNLYASSRWLASYMSRYNYHIHLPSLQIVDVVIEDSPAPRKRPKLETDVEVSIEPYDFKAESTSPTISFATAPSTPALSSVDMKDVRPITVDDNDIMATQPIPQQQGTVALPNLEIQLLPSPERLFRPDGKPLLLLPPPPLPLPDHSHLLGPATAEAKSSAISHPLLHHPEQAAETTAAPISLSQPAEEMEEANVEEMAIDAIAGLSVSRTKQTTMVANESTSSTATAAVGSLNRGVSSDDTATNTPIIASASDKKPPSNYELRDWEDALYVALNDNLSEGESTAGAAAINSNSNSVNNSRCNSAKEGHDVQNKELTRKVNNLCVLLEQMSQTSKTMSRQLNRVHSQQKKIIKLHTEVATQALNDLDGTELVEALHNQNSKLGQAYDVIASMQKSATSYNNMLGTLAEGNVKGILEEAIPIMGKLDGDDEDL